VEEVPRSEAPGAHRVAADTAALTAAVRVHLAAVPVRHPVPPVALRYDVTRSAAQLAALYTRLAGTAAPAGGPAATVPVLSRPEG
jgi:hypothetical protein